VDFTLLFLNALLFGILLSVSLSIVMLVSFAIAPDMWVGDYPPDIQERYGEMSPRAKRYRPLIASLFFGAVLICTALSIARLRALSPVEVGFLGYTLSTFLVLMTFNLYDLIIADWLIFVTLQPKQIILPGTEGLAGYKDYAFHFRGFLVGILFSAGGAIIIALMAEMLFNFIG
jgi:hypothetical protein